MSGTNDKQVLDQKQDLDRWAFLAAMVTTVFIVVLVLISGVFCQRLQTLMDDTEVSPDCCCCYCECVKVSAPN